VSEDVYFGAISRADTLSLKKSSLLECNCVKLHFLSFIICFKCSTGGKEEEHCLGTRVLSPLQAVRPEKSGLVFLCGNTAHARLN
jgi:hypothetical protein